MFLLRSVFTMASWAMFTGGLMQAQPASVTIDDSLKEVRVFGSGSPDFVAIAAAKGVDASLSTLGDGLPLVVAIRNDSGEDIESMRIFYRIRQGNRNPDQITLHGPLAAGASVLHAPRGLGGALAKLTPLQPGTIRTGASGPLETWPGAEVTVSIDSVTLASRRFVGPDTLGYFSKLVAEDARRKEFFRDVAAFESAGFTQAQIEQALNNRKAAADAAKGKMTSIRDIDLAAQTESVLCIQALAHLQHSEAATLFDWVASENRALAVKPAPHK